MKNKLKRILIYLLADFECKTCKRLYECDGKTWIHRVEDGCKYGVIHGK